MKTLLAALGLVGLTGCVAIDKNPLNMQSPQSKPVTAESLRTSLTQRGLLNVSVTDSLKGQGCFDFSAIRKNQWSIDRMNGDAISGWVCEDPNNPGLVTGEMTDPNGATQF